MDDDLDVDLGVEAVYMGLDTIQHAYAVGNVGDGAGRVGEVVNDRDIDVPRVPHALWIDTS